MNTQSIVEQSIAFAALKLSPPNLSAFATVLAAVGIAEIISKTAITTGEILALNGSNNKYIISGIRISFKKDVKYTCFEENISLKGISASFKPIIIIEIGVVIFPSRLNASVN